MCEYTVGYVDDDITSYNDYAKRLKRRGIELIFPDDRETKEQIFEWVQEKNIKCFIIDYKLNKVFDFSGTELALYLNSRIPDLPCLILTNYPKDAIDGNLVIQNMIENRDIMATSDPEKFEEFLSKVKQSVKVFEKRIENHKQEYKQLLDKKSGNTLSSSEEERFLDLYKLLRAYGEVDDLPAQLLESETSLKMDKLLQSVNNLIEKVEER